MEFAKEDDETIWDEVTVVVWVVVCAEFKVNGSAAIPKLIPIPKAIAIAENANIRLLYSDKRVTQRCQYQGYYYYVLVHF